MVRRRMSERACYIALWRRLLACVASRDDSDRVNTRARSTLAHNETKRIESETHFVARLAGWLADWPVCVCAYADHVAFGLAGAARFAALHMISARAQSSEDSRLRQAVPERARIKSARETSMDKNRSVLAVCRLYVGKLTPALIIRFDLQPHTHARTRTRPRASARARKQSVSVIDCFRARL